MRWILALFLSTGAAWPDCPPPVDIGDDLAALIEEARAAENDMAGQAVSNRMWQLWLRAPDEPAQALLDEGMRKRESFDYLGALEEFDRLTAYCPDYSEGYNQRAFINFLSGNHDAALPDLERALALSPDHVGAQSGRALTLLELGRLDEARTQLQAALENNPWLSERFLLSKGGPLAPDGEDI